MNETVIGEVELDKLLFPEDIFFQATEHNLIACYENWDKAIGKAEKQSREHLKRIAGMILKLTAEHEN